MTRRAKLPLEPLEQALDRPRLGQRLTEGPERVGVRNGIAQAEPQEPHPGQPVTQIELGALVAEVVLGLRDQDLEHQNVLERRAPTFDRSARGTARSSSGRNSSKATTAAHRSRAF